METKWYVWLFLIVFAVLALVSSTHNSATSDEVTHIASGYSYWTYFDYTLNPEHPPLVKLWSTIPLLVMSPEMPGEPAAFDGTQWDYGKVFLYQMGNDADLIYFWSRVMMVLIGLLLGYYIYRWATELFGWKAGLLALVLYVFDPNFLAHTAIVHTDVPIAAAIFITTYYFWKFLETNNGHFTLKQHIILGLLVGLCLATKFTGVYVILFLVILYFVHVYFDKYLHHLAALKTNLTKKIAKKDDFDLFEHLQGFYDFAIPRNLHLSSWWLLVTTLIVGFILLALTYGFVHFGGFFEGFMMVVQQSAEGRYAYLFESTQAGGWWYYFIVAFFVKTPGATLFLFASALFVFFQTKLQDNKAIRNALFLGVPAVLYFISFIFNDINIGHRHILPVYPFIFVFIGSVTVIDWDALGKQFAQLKRYARPVLLFFVAWLIVANLFVFPYYIPFFNFLVGGPDNGHTFLLDSNLDWGQGLKETAAWLEENGYGDETIRMSYFGNELAEYRGISANKIMCGPTPGIQVISANKLYDFQGNQFGCVDWLMDYEPIAVIGHSMYIFNIEDPYIEEKDALCRQNCAEGCSSRGEVYGDSMYKQAEDGCLCLCAEATNEELGIL
jgi:hypothetical protein